MWKMIFSATKSRAAAKYYRKGLVTRGLLVRIPFKGWVQVHQGIFKITASNRKEDVKKNVAGKRSCHLPNEWKFNIYYHLYLKENHSKKLCNSSLRRNVNMKLQISHFLLYFVLFLFFLWHKCFCIFCSQFLKINKCLFVNSKWNSTSVYYDVNVTNLWSM